MIKTLKTILLNINDLIVFKHSIFSLPFIFIAMLLSSKGVFTLTLFILCILAALFARNFAMAFNRLVDIDIDAKNQRCKTRPSVDGRLSKKFILLFTILNAFLFCLNAYFINDLSFKLSLPFLIILAFYSYTKRWTYFAHLFLGLALGLAPIAGDIAISSSISLWSIFLALGVLFWVAGFDILYSLQDMDFDKKEKLFSIPAKFGIQKSLHISAFFHILTIIFWLISIFVYQSSYILYIGVFLSFLMLVYEHYLVRQNVENIDKAFFVVNGYLGFIFLFFTILEVYL